MDENQFQYEVLVDTSMLGGDRALSIPGLMRLTEGVIEAHLLNIGMDVPRLIREHQVSWVSLSLCFDLPAPPEPGERLLGRSWCSGRNGPIFRREVCFTHRDGTPAILAADYCALLDLRTRRMVRDPAILERFRLPVGEPCLEAQSRIPSESADLQPVGSREILPSFIDGLGHMNNTRYGELVYDAIAQRRQPFGAMRRLELYFTRELRLGDTAELRLRETDGGYALLGLRRETGEQAFQSRVFFAS